MTRKKGKDKIMNAITIRENAVRGGKYHVYEAPEGVRRSYAATQRLFQTPSGTGRPIKYGDRLLVKLVRVQPGGRTIAEFTMSEVNDMTEIYGELRHYTRGLSGLTRLTVRNVTRGWSLEQPFMLYADAARRLPAVSVSRPAVQPSGTRRREIPESIRMLYGEH